jgi:hypothetical protein
VRPRWKLIAAAASVFLVIIIAAWKSTPSVDSGSPVPISPNGASRNRGGAKWLTINYNELVDREVLTHSGRTVGALLDQISGTTTPTSKNVLSDLQPYLEPFSFVCNDIVAASTPSNQMVYANTTAEFPAGSRQPAWAALFRGGMYQLFIGDGRARLFIKGKDPEELFSAHHSVVRHPLRMALEQAGTSTLAVEVYAFENNYVNRSISLDINPYVVNVNLDTLHQRKKGFPLDGIGEFLAKGVTLDAVEIDENQDFFFYGTPSTRQTLAGRPQSLEDLAVIYRATFHYGHNAPYISLDRHEDNRFAKVNFGGFFEDTRVGSVVLEADKLFKTMSTGLDPNSRRNIRGTISKFVPDFLTEDERSLSDGSEGMGHQQIRYWFYPDKIQTVTDGRIAAVQSSQFMADAERMDQKATLSRPLQETINHLNTNFYKYSQGLPTFRELDSVGRLMAVVNWLRSSGAGNQVDLDDLLAVELSAFETPRKTKKILAISAEAGPEHAERLSNSIRRKVYCLDSVLDGADPSMSDQDILNLASTWYRQHPDPDLAPDGKGRMEWMKSRLNVLQSSIDRDREYLNRYDRGQVARFNANVEEYNSLKDDYNMEVAAYNRRGYRTHTIVSVGGGINLRPDDFAKPANNPSSPLLQQVRSVRDQLRVSPGMSTPLVRSAQHTSETGGKGGTSVRPWSVKDSRMESGVEHRSWVNQDQGTKTLATDSSSGASQYSVEMKGYSSQTVIRPGRKEVEIRSSASPVAIHGTGDFSSGGVITLRRGLPIGLTPIQKPAGRIKSRPLGKAA